MKPNWLLAILTCCSLESCFLDHCSYDSRLKLYNNNPTRPIAWAVKFDFPDTSLGVYDDPHIDGNNGIIIPPGERGTVAMRTDCWESTYGSRIPSGKMQLLIFDADTLTHYSWNEIRTNNKILKRYTVTLDDLKAMDWKITYP